MAKVGTKTEMLRCNVGAEKLVFQHVERENEEWVVVAELEMACANVPDRLEDGDGFASMKAYGIRAFVSDRTSQFRSYGIAHTMEEMQAVYNMLCSGVYRAKRKAGAGNDLDLMAQAIADLKGVSIDRAKATVKALSKEQQASVRSNKEVAAKMLELRVEVDNAEVVDLGDLF
jgi:hypothetical protein